MTTFETQTELAAHLGLSSIEMARVMGESKNTCGAENPLRGTHGPYTERDAEIFRKWATYLVTYPACLLKPWSPPDVDVCSECGTRVGEALPPQIVRTVLFVEHVDHITINVPPIPGAE